MKNIDSYENYLFECTEQLKEEYQDAILEEEKEIKKGKKEAERSFETGVRRGYYLALEILRNQAVDFQIPLENIGLEEEIEI